MRPVPFTVLGLVLVFAVAACGGAAGDGAPDAVPDGVAPDSSVDASADPDTRAGSDVVADAGGEDVAALPAYYRAGVAVQVITPDTPQVLGGYGFCTGGIENCRWSAGVHDDLLATALAVEEARTGAFVVFVGVDALGLMRPDVLALQAAFSAKVEAETGAVVSGDRIVVGSSHAHSTPDSVGIYGSTPEQTGRDEAYMAFVVDRAAQAAADAWLARDFAAIRVARGWHDNAPDIDDEDVPMEMDGRLTVLTAERLDGGLVGTMTFWAAHPTVYPMENHALSADWVGTFRHRMAERLGAAVHGHVQGPIGAVYAVTPDECPIPNPFVDGWQDPELEARHHDRVACVGYAVADAALDALEDAAPLAEGPVDVRMAELGVPILNQMYRILAGFGMIAREIPPGDEPAPSHMTWARLGQLRFVTAPGEAFPRYANALRERAAELETGVDAEDVVVVGLGNDWTGYLLLREQYVHEAYGYHRSLCPGPAALEAQLDGLERLLGE